MRPYEDFIGVDTFHVDSPLRLYEILLSILYTCIFQTCSKNNRKESMLVNRFYVRNYVIYTVIFEL